MVGWTVEGVPKTLSPLRIFWRFWVMESVVAVNVEPAVVP